jgi:hypothetical protein
MYMISMYGVEHDGIVLATLSKSKALLEYSYTIAPVHTLTSK